MARYRPLVLRRLRLILTFAAPAVFVLTGTALAQPTLRLGQYCPVVAGAQQYGVEASLSGLPANAVFDFSYNFGGVSGDVTAVQADDKGNVGPLRVAFSQPVKFVAVGLSSLSPADPTIRLHETLETPCKHAGVPAQRQ